MIQLAACCCRVRYLKASKVWAKLSWVGSWRQPEQAWISTGDSRNASLWLAVSCLILAPLTGNSYFLCAEIRQQQLDLFVSAWLRPSDLKFYHKCHCNSTSNSVCLLASASFQGSRCSASRAKLVFGGFVFARLIPLTSFCISLQQQPKIVVSWIQSTSKYCKLKVTPPPRLEIEALSES